MIIAEIPLINVNITGFTGELSIASLSKSRVGPELGQKRVLKAGHCRANARESHEKLPLQSIKTGGEHECRFSFTATRRVVVAWLIWHRTCANLRYRNGAAATGAADGTAKGAAAGGGGDRAEAPAEHSVRADRHHRFHQRAAS